MTVPVLVRKLRKVVGSSWKNLRMSTVRRYMQILRLWYQCLEVFASAVIVPASQESMILSCSSSGNPLISNMVISESTAEECAAEMMWWDLSRETDLP